jgi:hypothetical protein
VTWHRIAEMVMTVVIKRLEHVGTGLIRALVLGQMLRLDHGQVGFAQDCHYAHQTDKDKINSFADYD